MKEKEVTYICPMHPEIRQPGPGVCPKCCMALEPVQPSIPSVKTEWTCPMHPEIVRDVPGSCPICGMALEPKTITSGEEENPELLDMTRRFKVSVVLTVPSGLNCHAPLYSRSLHHRPRYSRRRNEMDGIGSRHAWVLWGAWPFFVRGWQSFVTWNPNMFTLIGLGVGVAYTRMRDVVVLN